VRGHTESAILLLRRLAHQSKTALRACTEIAEIEREDLRKQYAGKKAPKVSRKKLTSALTIDGATIIKMEREAEQKELQLQEKAAIKKEKNKAKSIIKVSVIWLPPESPTLPF
jgi:hypothetical protein